MAISFSYSYQYHTLDLKSLFYLPDYKLITNSIMFQGALILTRERMGANLLKDHDHHYQQQSLFIVYRR